MTLRLLLYNITLGCYILLLSYQFMQRSQYHNIVVYHNRKDLKLISYPITMVLA